MNSLWFEESNRYLWRAYSYDGTKGVKPRLKCLIDIDSSRRQGYINNIRQLTFNEAYEGDKNSKSTPHKLPKFEGSLNILQFHTFPSLMSVDLLYPGDDPNRNPSIAQCPVPTRKKLCIQYKKLSTDLLYALGQRCNGLQELDICYLGEPSNPYHVVDPNFPIVEFRSLLGQLHSLAKLRIYSSYYGDIVSVDCFDTLAYHKSLEQTSARRNVSATYQQVEDLIRKRRIGQQLFSRLQYLDMAVDSAGLRLLLPLLTNVSELILWPIDHECLLGSFEVGTFKNLETVRISGEMHRTSSLVTFAKSVPNLKDLYISWYAVTDDEIDEFTRYLPKLVGFRLCQDLGSDIKLTETSLCSFWTALSTFGYVYASSEFSIRQLGPRCPTSRVAITDNTSGLAMLARF